MVTDIIKDSKMIRGITLRLQIQILGFSQFNLRHGYRKVFLDCLIFWMFFGFLISFSFLFFLVQVF